MTSGLLTNFTNEWRPVQSDTDVFDGIQMFSPPTSTGDKEFPTYAAKVKDLLLSSIFGVTKFYLQVIKRIRVT
jgi:hypothetical protein